MSPDDQALIERMNLLSREWESMEDNRHIFLRCYSMMTANMLQALDESRFQDNAWVRKLLHRFADYYFDALACFDCGDKVPAVWEEAHRTTATRKMHVLQNLLLGVNAHINYDLVLTLDEILRNEWDTLPEETRALRYADHCLVNQIIGETIDAVQDEVVEDISPIMDIVDRIMGRQDERMLLYLISKWRDEVWHEAIQLMSCKTDAERESCRQKVEEKVLRKAKYIHF